MTTDDLPIAFRPFRPAADGHVLSDDKSREGYNDALKRTDAAGLYRDNQRLRAALNRFVEYYSLGGPSDMLREAREALRGDAQHP